MNGLLIDLLLGVLQFGRGLMEHVTGTRFVANGTGFNSVVNNGLHRKLLLQSHGKLTKTLPLD